MSYSLLQDAVNDLKGHNRVVTDKLIANGGEAVTGTKTAKDHREATIATRQATEPVVTDTTAERDGGIAAQTTAEGELASAQTARDTTLDQPALAQTEAARAVSAANTKAVTALGVHSGLDSVASEHIRPSLVLDFANQEYWKQGTYPWIKETLDPAVDLTFTRGSTATYFDANGVMQMAGVDEMRIDHDPQTGECLGVLIEPTRTNLLTYSASLDYPAWERQGVVVEPNAAVSPNGSVSADEVSAVSAGASAFFRQDTALSAGQSYTMSVYAKAAKSGVLQIAPSTGFNSSSYRNFDLINGVLGAGGSVDDSGIEYVGGGYYRCWVTDTAGTGGSGRFIITLPDSPDSSRNAAPGYLTSVFVWGVQFEEGSYPTSYIPTNGAAVTRASDTLYKTIDASYIQGRGVSLLAHARRPESVSGTTNYSRYAPTMVLGSWYNNQFGLSSISGGAVYSYRRTLNGTDSAAGGPYPAGVFTWLGGSHGGFRRHVAGGGISTSAVSVHPDFTWVEPIWIGGEPTYGARLGGHVKYAALYPFALSATELEELTS